MKYYYLAFPPSPFGTFFTLLRLVGDPSYSGRLPAHITVQGPLFGVPSAPKLVFSTPVRVRLMTLGRFWNDSQSTIFYHLSAPDLESYWYKPDYGDFVPHITVYDGPDRAYAEKLWTLYNQMPKLLTRSFVLTSLEIWPSKSVSSSHQPILGIPASAVHALSVDERLRLLANIYQVAMIHPLLTDPSSSYSHVPTQGHEIRFARSPVYPFRQKLIRFLTQLRPEWTANFHRWSSASAR